MITEGTNETANSGTASNDWRSGLPDDLREAPSIRDFKDISGLVKSYIHAQSLIGRDKIPVPNSENPEDWNAVYDRLGRPKDHSEYGFKKPENWSHEWDDNLTQSFAKTAHELGLNTKQAQKLFEFYNGHVSTQYSGYEEKRTAQTQQAEQQLKKEWGQEYDTSLNEASKALKHYAGDEGAKALGEAGLLNNPAIIKMFHTLSNSLKEDSSIGINQSIPHNSRELAKQEYSQLMQDKEFKNRFYDASSVGHDTAVQKAENLLKLIHGNF